MTEFCATLVAHDAVNKLEALKTVADACGSSITGGATPHPRINLSPGVWIEIDIPKFGEPPPLAIDVYSDVSLENAQREALAVMAALEAATLWRVTPDFEAPA